MPETKRKFIAVEGPIGVGKTTLVHLLSERFQARELLEIVEENPFLPLFYEDRERYSFQTQLFFLLSRFKQQEDILQGDLFNPGGVVSDYLLIKDRLFANMNLKDKELVLYDRLWEILAPRAPKPDLVVLLMARMDVLLHRISIRGRDFEQQIERDYLEEVTRIYSEHFLEYNESPLLVVDSSEVDFVHSKADLDHLIAVIREHQGGVQYYKPLGSQ